jgi:hypothetical protein
MENSVKKVVFLTLSVLMSDMVESMDEKVLTALQPKVKDSESHEYMSIYLSIVNGDPRPTSENIKTFEKIAKTCSDLYFQTKIILGIYYLKHNLTEAKALLREGLRDTEGKGYAYYLTGDPTVKGKDIEKSIDTIIKAKNPFSSSSDSSK